jgi:hypothetical protein
MEDAKMKKTYINPETKTIKIDTMQMLAASVEVLIVGGEYGGEFNAPGLDLEDEVFNPFSINK